MILKRAQAKVCERMDTQEVLHAREGHPRGTACERMDTQEVYDWLMRVLASIHAGVGAIHAGVGAIQYHPRAHSMQINLKDPTADGSAFASSNTFTISKFPAAAATNTGVVPSIVSADGSAFAVSNIWTNAKCPSWVAVYKGVACVG
jgi:hypothetical protein